LSVEQLLRKLDLPESGKAKRAVLSDKDFEDLIGRLKGHSGQTTKE